MPALPRLERPGAPLLPSARCRAPRGQQRTRVPPRKRAPADRTPHPSQLPRPQLQLRPAAPPECAVPQPPRWCLSECPPRAPPAAPAPPPQQQRLGPQRAQRECRQKSALLRRRRAWRTRRVRLQRLWRRGGRQASAQRPARLAPTTPLRPPPPSQPPPPRQVGSAAPLAVRRLRRRGPPAREARGASESSAALCWGCEAVPMPPRARACTSCCAAGCVLNSTAQPRGKERCSPAAQRGAARGGITAQLHCAAARCARGVLAQRTCSVSGA